MEEKFGSLREVVEFVRGNAFVADAILRRDRFTIVTVNCLVPLWRRDGTRIIKELHRTEISEWASKYRLPYSLTTGYDVAWGKATKSLAKDVWASQKWHER